MRDLALFALLLGILPLIVRAPIVGVMAWIWISLFNPQREVYGFLSGANLNFIIAAATIFAWAISKERKTAPANLMPLLMGAFIAWTCVTTYFALVPEHAQDLLVRTIKTAVLLVAVAAIANTKSRIQAVVWAVAVSLAYFSVKGGGFVVISGGSHRVYGPPNSMIADNNQLGLALVMLLPLLYYLRATTKARLVRLACLGVMILTFIAIIGTYSRGALLAVGAMVAMLALRSRTGLLTLAVAAGLVVYAPKVLPAAWMERMSTIQGMEADNSFAGRIEAWKTSFNVAMHRVTGGGFSSIEHDWVAQAYPISGGLPFGRAAHSVYFQVLGDHGFIGLGLYLAMLGAALLNTAMTLGATRGRPELRWANQLARMLQVSIIAYLVGGAALSMAYYDGFLVIVVLTAALHHVVKRGAVETFDAAGSPVPKWKVVDAPAPAALPPPSARPELS